MLRQQQDDQHRQRHSTDQPRTDRLPGQPYETPDRLLFGNPRTQTSGELRGRLARYKRLHAAINERSNFTPVLIRLAAGLACADMRKQFALALRLQRPNRRPIDPLTVFFAAIHILRRAVILSEAKPACRRQGSLFILVLLGTAKPASLLNAFAPDAAAT